MKFIEFTTPKGRAFSVNPDFLSSVIPTFRGDLETGCHIYVAGDSNPFQTVELYADVMAKLNGSTATTEQKPLTCADLIKMQDTAVWVQPKGDPLNGKWGVVESASEGIGVAYLYLWGDPWPHEIGKTDEAFRHRPEPRKGREQSESFC